jgi:hypothetical protein
MKRFKDLDKEQKKKAVDYVYKRLLNKEIYDTAKYANKRTDSLNKKLQEIKDSVGFCGCMSCLNSFRDKANLDPVVKEWVLAQAMEGAEQAYYPEADDDIVKV